MALTPAEKQRRYRERLKAGKPLRSLSKAPRPALPCPALVRCGGRTRRFAGA